MTKQGITIALFLAALITGMVAWEWNTMAQGVKENRTVNTAQDKILVEIKTNQAAYVKAQEASAAAMAEQTKLLKQLAEAAEKQNAE